MEHQSFKRFLSQREQAASAYVKGNGAVLDKIVTHQGEATFHSPGGDTINGAENVAQRYLKDSKQFKPNGTSHFEIIQSTESDDLAFWTGFQVANVQIGSMPQPMDMKIRITEIFKRVEGDWKMIHRHADMPKEQKH